VLKRDKGIGYPIWIWLESLFMTLIAIITVAL